MSSGFSVPQSLVSDPGDEYQWQSRWEISFPEHRYPIKDLVWSEFYHGVTARLLWVSPTVVWISM